MLAKCVEEQEIKYVEKLQIWEEAIKNMKGENHKKICSRLLKYFYDDYLLNRRTKEDELEIIRRCIDANIPIPEEKSDGLLRKSASKSVPKAKKGAGTDATRSSIKSTVEEKKKPTRKDIYSISQEKMRESLSLGAQHGADRSSVDGLDELDFTEAGLEQHLEGGGQGPLKKRVSQVHRERIAARV